MKDGKEILSLTGLRFVAAFYVFLFHIHIRWPLAHDKFFKRILSQGAVGMSLFFLLSGFVLSYRYADSKASLKDYLVNRFARIYPIYFAAALVTLPWLGITFKSYSPLDLLAGLGQGFFLVLADIFLLQAWFPQLFQFWNNSGSWSISVEAFCYFLLPFLLVHLSGLSATKRKWMVVFCLVLCALPGISAKLFKDPLALVFYSLPIFRLPEFIIGACMYFATIDNRHKIYTAKHQAGALLLLLVYLGVVGSGMPYYVGHNWLAIPIIAFMVYSLSFGNGFFSNMLSSKVFVWLGKISYSFYSFQTLIILILVNNRDSIVETFPPLQNNLALAAVSLLALLILSVLGYYLVEEPSRRWIRNRYSGEVA